MTYENIILNLRKNLEKDQCTDLTTEIDSLKLIAQDVRPVMSPDKTFELAFNEVVLIMRRLSDDEQNELKVAL